MEEYAIEEYIESVISPEPERLRRLDRETHLRMVHPRMCSGHIQGRLLKMLVEMIRPQRILELGTFTGYATLCLAEGAPEDAVIDTVEACDELEPQLRRLFESFSGERRAESGEGRMESGEGCHINLHIADAETFLESAPAESYDLIYIDADKRRYPQYLEGALKAIRPGGYILADNTLWGGHVIERKRHDPLTEGIRRFNEMVAANPRLEKCIIPLRDGLTVIKAEGRR